MPITIDQNERGYFPKVKQYLLVLVSDLNQALMEGRVSRQIRRQICGTFLVSHCEKLDQEWLRCKGQTWYPLIAFTKSFIELATAPIADNSMLIGDKGNELHAIASALIDEFFDELHERLPENTTGQIGDELPDAKLETVPEPRPKLPCFVCKGSGLCFCLRKGLGTSDNCRRCAGLGKCPHCRGTGLSNP